MREGLDLDLSSLTLTKEGRAMSLECGQPWKLDKARKQILPRASRREHSAANTLISAQRDLCQTSKLQTFKMINLFCFKPLNWWQVVMVAIENSYTQKKQMGI